MCLTFLQNKVKTLIVLLLCKYLVTVYYDEVRLKKGQSHGYINF